MVFLTVSPAELAEIVILPARMDQKAGTGVERNCGIEQMYLELSAEN